MDWIGLVQERDNLRAVVKAVMKFESHKIRGIP